MHGQLRSIHSGRVVDQYDPRVGQGKFKGFSAGSHPKGAVHPLALETLRAASFNAEGFRSKSWNEFAQSDAPPLDLVFTSRSGRRRTVPDVAGTTDDCAIAGIPDPAAVQGSDAEKRRAFKEALLVLRRRIELFACLPLDKLDRLALQKKIRDIGQS